MSFIYTTNEIKKVTFFLHKPIKQHPCTMLERMATTNEHKLKYIYMLSSYTQFNASLWFV